MNDVLCFRLSMNFGSFRQEWDLNKTKYLLWSFSTIFFLYQFSIRTAVPNVLNEDLRKYFSIDATKMGGLVSLFYLAYTVMQIPAGLIVDRFSSKNILICASLAVALGEISFIITDVYIIAAVSQIVLGIGASFAFILVLKISDDYFPREKVALVSSLSLAIGSFGPTIMNPALAYLSAVFYWKYVVISIGMIGVVFSLLPILIFRGNSFRITDTVSRRNGGVSIRENFKQIAADRQYIALGVFSMMSLSALSAFCDVWGGTFLRNSAGYSKEEASMLLSVSYVGIIFGEPFAAWLSKKLRSFKKIMVYNSLLSLPAYVLILFFQLSKTELTIVLFLIGVLGSCQFLTFPFAICCAPKRIGGTVNGVINMVTMLGVTIMSYLIGFMLDLSHGEIRSAYTIQDYRNSFILLPVSVVLSVVALFFVKDLYPLEKENK